MCNDDDIKLVVGRLSPSVYESLWNGTIHLSSSVKAALVAFYKSGEKIQDIVWPKIIVIKGKVKLEAFEKFVQELRHSRNRSIMVISLCWKVGSSKAGLKGMKETLVQVATSFEVSQKVGFAEICDGSGLYVCPRSEAIITILDKYGFFKGMTAADTNQDSLMGFVVCDRKPVLTITNGYKSGTSASSVGAKPPTSVPCSEGHQATPYNTPGMASMRNTSNVQSSIEKIQEIGGSYVEAQDVAEGFPCQCVHAGRTGEKVKRPEAALPKSPFKLASTLLMQSPQITSFRGPSFIACQQLQAPPLQLSSHEVSNPLLTTLEIRQHVQHVTDSHCGSLGVGHPDSRFHVLEIFTSAFKPYKTGIHKLPLQSLDVPQGAIHSDLATEKNHMEGAFCGSITQQKYPPSAVESPELQQIPPLLLHPDSYDAPIPDDKDDLPDFDFPSACGAEVKPNVHPLNETARTFHGLMRSKLPDNESGGQFQQPSYSVFQVESIRPCENVGAQGPFTRMVRRKITNLISHCNTERDCFRDNDGIGDGDMTRCNFPELDHHKLYKNGPTESPLPSLKTFTRAEEQLQSFPPITLRPESRAKSCLFIDRHPHMPSGCLNPPRDEGLFHHHRPDVEADQGLFPRHPPVLVDQGLFPRHPPPVLADQGLFPRHPPPVLADQGFFHGHPPALRDQGLFPPHRPPVSAYQGFFPRHPPHILRDQGFIPHHPPPILAPGYFSSSGDQGNNNGTFPVQQDWMFDQRPGTSYASSTSEHIRPPSGFAPRGAWRPRPGSNSYGFERSDGSLALTPHQVIILGLEMVQVAGGPAQANGETTACHKQHSE